MRLQRLAREEGDPGALALGLQLRRLCALYVVESMDASLLEAVEAHVLRLAAAK